MLCWGKLKGEPVFTLKLPPEYGETLRRIYSGIIIPGYYMNKVHWNSLLLNKIDAVTEQLVMEMIDSSYDTILKSLPKKKQKEIEEM